MKHAELDDLAADTIDFDPVAKPHAILSHQHQPADESDYEVLQGHREAGADDAQHRGELRRHSDQHQQDHDDAQDLEAHARDTAQGLHLAPVDFHAPDESLEPLIDKHQEQQDNDHDNHAQQARVHHGRGL